ncbi:MAG: carbon starvation protein A [Planctomycetes bacterium]|nr:carbon starvation protein A [Planctomycetota bacterium]
MEIFALLIGTLAFFALAYKFYGGYISKLLGTSDERVTPAEEQTDGKDFVPTKTPVVFAHHFATIAGAGPIVGPVIALAYGYGPAWLWIVMGAVFFGAVHDYTALFISLREKGKSIADVARGSIGKTGYVLFIIFTIMLLTLVTGAFLGISATALTSWWPLEKLYPDMAAEGKTIDEIRDATFLRVGYVGEGGAVVDEPAGLSQASLDNPQGCLGGIASMSVIIVTLLAPLLGWLLVKRGLNVKIVFVLATIVCVLSIVFGIAYPITLDPKWWMVALAIYVLFACGLPVWMILQPRDLTNVQILYAGMGIIVVGVVANLFRGNLNFSETTAPALNQNLSPEMMMWIWPTMFITIACGAISGFHSLVGSGTTSKQIMKERNARSVGFGGMLLEATLAVLVVITVAFFLDFNSYTSIVPPGSDKGNPILAFSLGVGHLLHKGLAIPVAYGCIAGILIIEGFVVTTLDSAVRMNRYLFEELWKFMFEKPHWILRQAWFNASLCVLLMLALAWKGSWKMVWKSFGTSNQLMAVLGLIAMSFWLFKKGKAFWFTAIPAVFMTLTTGMSLYLITNEHLELYANSTEANEVQLVILLCFDAVLAILTGGVVLVAGYQILAGVKREPELAPEEA